MSIYVAGDASFNRAAVGSLVRSLIDLIYYSTIKVSYSYSQGREDHALLIVFK